MKLFKNTLFWGFLLFLGGMIVGGFGWGFNESTIEEKSHWGVPLIALGIAMILLGVVIFFTSGKKK